MFQFVSRLLRKPTMTPPVPEPIGPGDSPGDGEASPAGGPGEILAEVRERLVAFAGEDPDRWFYANRFVFARLQLDERKTKVRVKKHLIESKGACHGCGKPFASAKGIHLHRLDGERGYSRADCVLMHPECHRALHAAAEAARPTNLPSDADQMPTGVVSKESRRYAEVAWVYWWDVSPTLHARLGDLGMIELVRKDDGARALVDAGVLRTALTPARQTSRGQGNWGLRIFPEEEEILRVESPGPRAGWPGIALTWLTEEED